MKFERDGMKTTELTNSPARILVVDDEQDTLDYLELLLQREGFDVSCALSGEEALEILHKSDEFDQKSIDLILLDILMPDMNGVEVLQRIRSDESLSSILVLVLTCLEKVDDKVRAFDAGTDDYLTKPFDHRELRVRIQALLGSREIEQKTKHQNEALKALYEIGKEITSVHEVDKLLKLIAEKAVNLVKARRSLFLLVDTESEKLSKVAEYGYEYEHLDSFTYSEFIAGLSGWVYRKGESAITANAQEDSRQTGIALERAKEFNTGALIVAPISINETVNGTLTVANTVEDPVFTEEDRDLVVMLANQTAIAIENARLLTKSQKAKEELDGLIASSFDAVIVIDTDNKIIVFNKQAENIFDYSAKEMLGKSVARLHNEIDIARGIHTIIQNEGAISNYEVSLIDKQENEILALLSCTLLLDSKGNTIGQAGFIKDIRQMHLLEGRLHSLVFAAKAINSEMDQEKVLELVINSALNAFPLARRGSIHLFKEKTDRLHLVVSTHEYSPDAKEALRFKIGEGVAGWVYKHNQPVMIPNAQEDPRYTVIDHPDVPSHKSMICAPLSSKEKVIGVITLNNPSVEDAFDTDDLGLLSAFADQAAIAIGNAKQFEHKQKEVRDRELLREISANISTKTTIEGVLKSLVDGAAHLLGVEMATVHLQEKDTGDFQSFIAPQDKSELFTHPREKDGLTAEIIKTGHMIIVPDTTEMENVNPEVVKVGIQSFIGYPLAVRGIIIGALFLDSTSPQFFGDREIELVQLLVSQVTIAIENIRVLNRLERHVYLEDVLIKTSRELTRKRGLDDQLEIVWQLVRDEFLAPMFFIGIYDDLIDILRFEIAYDMGEPVEKFNISLTDRENWGLAAYVAKTGAYIEWFSQQQKQEALEELGIRENLKGEPCATCLIQPLNVRGERIGVISIQSNKSYAWDEVEVGVFQTLANLVAVAIQNTKLIEDIVEGQNRLRTAYSASKVITSTLNPDQALHSVVEQACGELDAWWASVLLIDAKGNPERLEVVGFDKELRIENYIRPGGGIQGSHEAWRANIYFRYSFRKTPGESKHDSRRGRCGCLLAIGHSRGGNWCSMGALSRAPLFYRG